MSLYSPNEGKELELIHQSILVHLWPLHVVHPASVSMLQCSHFPEPLRFPFHLSTSPRLLLGHLRSNLLCLSYCKMPQTISLEAHWDVRYKAMSGAFLGCPGEMLSDDTLWKGWFLMSLQSGKHHHLWQVPQCPVGLLSTGGYWYLVAVVVGG